MTRSDPPLHEAGRQTATPRIALSIVSHGQGELVSHLLRDLAPHVTPDMEIIVTLNLPEDDAFARECGLPVRILRNLHVKGYGANHNQAFATTRARCFAVLNPDLRLPNLDLDALLAVLDDPRISAVAPLVRDVDGNLEDSARRFPSLGRILQRSWLRVSGRRPPPDYHSPTAATMPVDWVAGMFVVFRSEAFRQLAGYDEGFFMYLEDVDICARLWLAGGAVHLCPASEVVHDARRATLKSPQHLRWHVSSLLRYFRLSLIRPEPRKASARSPS